QPPRGRDHGRPQDREAPRRALERGRGRPDRDRAHHAPLALARPPRRRRRRRGALHDDGRQVPRGPEAPPARGHLVATAPSPALPRFTGEGELGADRLRELYKYMQLIRAIDHRMLALQRQGRIAFCGLTTGQEAAVVGSGAAVEKDDWVFPALREAGVALLRGFPVSRFFAQMFGNAHDVLKGRMQPMHFADRSVNQVSWSSCIATQLPHAVGAAYAMKLRKDGRVALGYLGDGATSEHDFHVALNFAGVWRVRCVFVCQNNQWAISVPFSKQTASDGVAVKAAAYGMPGVRVDGNDLLAVHAAVKEAADRARSGGGPSLVEAVTYRMSGHSSSDDPTRYRD